MHQGDLTWVMKEGPIWAGEREQSHPLRGPARASGGSLDLGVAGAKGKGGRADEHPGSHWALKHTHGPITCQVNMYLLSEHARSVANTRNVSTWFVSEITKKENAQV